MLVLSERVSGGGEDPDGEQVRGLPPPSPGGEGEGGKGDRTSLGWQIISVATHQLIN